MDEHQCCPSDPVQQNRFFANNIVERAQPFVNLEGRSVCEKLLVAARAVLEASGGVNGEEGVWLLTAEAHLPALDENHDGALTIFQEALSLARTELDEGHFAIAVCAHNVGDTCLELGDPEKALPFLEEAHTLLKACIETNEEDHLDEYFASVLKEVEPRLTKARELTS